MPECGLRRIEIDAGSWNGPAPMPPVRAEYAAGWRDDGLYVFVQVYAQPVRPHAPDQPIFCGDAVEIYVDANSARAGDAGAYAASRTMQFVVAAPSADSDQIDAWRFVRGNSQGAWIARGRVVKARADGYLVEATISAADLGLWQWSPHAALGFNLAVDVRGCLRAACRPGAALRPTSRSTACPRGAQRRRPTRRAVVRRARVLPACTRRMSCAADC